MDDQHALTRGRHRRRRPFEGIRDGRVYGYEQPTTERMIIPVGVVSDLAPVLHRVCLGRIGALIVVDPARPAIEVDPVNQPAGNENKCQQGQAPPVREQPAGDARSGSGHAIPEYPTIPGTAAAAADGDAIRIGDRQRDRGRGRGHETPSSSEEPNITTWWAPTCVVFSHCTLPWTSRTMARSAATDKTS